MHGTMIAIKNRKGRKRKSGRRTASGRLICPPVDYRASVGEQPHRNWLPEGHRLDERAGDLLGCLNLLWRVREAKNAKLRLSKLPEVPNPGVTDHSYEAGRRFSVIVGAYRVAIGTPRGTVGGGRGYVCEPQVCTAYPETCTCETRTARYRDACGALQSAGQKAYNVTYQVVISEMIPEPNQMPDLICGLRALERFFGLGRR